MNIFLKIFAAVFMLALAGCATTPEGQKRQVANAGAGAVVGGLLGYAVAGSKGAERGAAAGAAIGAYGSGGANVNSATIPPVNINNPEVRKAYEEGRKEARAEKLVINKCRAKNQGRNDEGVPAMGGCGNSADYSTYYRPSGYVSRYYTNSIFWPQYYWGYGYRNYNYNRDYRRGTRAWRNYNYTSPSVNHEFNRGRERTHREFERGRR